VFGLVTGFIEHLYAQLVTTSNCSTIANSHSAIYEYYSMHLSLLSLLCLHQSSGNGFQRRTFQLTLGSRTVTVPQLSASHSNSSQGLNRGRPLTHSLTNKLTVLYSLTPRLAAIAHQPSTLLSAA
jgi:hypothetical protein